jgi:hypothetical protein
MKTLVVAFCFLATSAALAQVGAGGSVLSSEPSFVEFNSHPARANQMGMAEQQIVLERSNSMIAQGERPLWELAPKVTVVPLGDIARAVRKERLVAKKSTTIWEN